jgi:hypothetical protein
MTTANANLTRTCENLTFGIEIETIAPTSLASSDNLRIGPYKHGIQVPYLPRGWTAERDGSINGQGSACEIVSPILKGAEGLRQVAHVAATLTAKGHKVNASTGVHVHVGWDPNTSSKALAKLITIVAYLEAGLYAATGTKNRERNTYSKGIKQYAAADAARRTITRDRYHGLNLTNLALGTKKTVEFRFFSGSTNAAKLVAWVCLCLGIVERALEDGRNPSWSPKPLKGGWAKKGLGASEVERMIGYLAWDEGQAKARGGKTYGWIDNGSVDKATAKSQLRRLAENYDSQA